MVDIRKIAIIFVIAVLFSILTFTTIDAIYPSPEYNDYCNQSIYDRQITTQSACTDIGGRWNPAIEETKPVIRNSNQYDCTKIDENNGNITLNCVDIQQEFQGYCDPTYTCSQNYDDANQRQKLILFLISTIVGMLAILYGIYLSPESNDINEWMGTGFMLGGLLNIFIGTTIYFQYTDRIFRPLIIFLELGLIIFIAYKKLGKKTLEQITGKKIKRK